jgi:hypothetical protein
MRLPAQFAVGAALPKVRNVELIRRQGTELWKTDTQREPQPRLREATVVLGQGPDIAVVVGITNDPADDVVAFARTARLPVDTLFVLQPPGNPADDAVHGPGHAIGIVQAVRDAVRHMLRQHPDATIHLFLSCPGALAMFLGHRWNRVARTVIYEDLKSTYQAAFIVAA